MRSISNAFNIIVYRRFSQTRPDFLSLSNSFLKKDQRERERKCDLPQASLSLPRHVHLNKKRETEYLT